MVDIREMLNKFLPKDLAESITELGGLLEGIEEVRIRQDKPFAIKYKGKEINLNSLGVCSADKAFKPTAAVIADIVARMCEYSPHAYAQEMKRGYITLEGGYRVGISGSVAEKNGEIYLIRHFSSLNIRIAREIKGCADKIMKYIEKSIMIISPPACGKTTLLRDIIRQLSNQGSNICVVDERGELSGTYQGKAQLDLGDRTDVLCGCGKTEGMLMMLRSMAPDIIAVDEIGTREDAIGIREVFNCGVYIICTIHGASLDEIRNKPAIGELIEERLFNRYIVLSAKNGAGTIEKIYDRELKKLCL